LLCSTAVIVNTSRGGIVNEIHLEQFLINNPESFAAFDVFLKEPVLNSPLFTLNNFFGTSHRASLTYEGINAMGMAAIKGLDDNVEVNFLNRL
jgi:lactate dehydrogenase-like 2-hydroxyacid dehydrogenase